VRVLFVSYDGMLEPLGQSQVLPYLTGLAKLHRVFLVSYEKAADWADAERRDSLRARIAEDGIHWVPLRYHKRPTAPATAYDILAGLVVVAYLGFRERIEIVHARSYVPAVIGVSIQALLHRRFLFDMRGFWADERVEAGAWKRTGRLYRVAKWFEKLFLQRADGVISLTHAAVDVMKALPYLQGAPPRFQVITTCTNLERFHVGVKPAFGTRPGFVLGYVGSVGAWDMFDEVAECFKTLREQRPDAFLLVINRGGHDYIFDCLERHRIARELVEVKACDYSAVPTEMGRMDAGIFFYKPGFSRAACSPTKLGEFLACGLPCLANRGVGDVESILEPERVGVVLEGRDPEARSRAVQRLLDLAKDPEIALRCAAVARRLFSLEEGIAAYDAMYRMIMGPHA